MKQYGRIFLLALALGAGARARAGDHNLADFGPVGTPAEAEAALSNALPRIIAEGGGFLYVQPGVAPDWAAHNPAPSSTQAGAPTVTVVDRRGGVERVLLPSNGQRSGSVWTGRHLRREVRRPIDMTLGVHSTEAVDTHIAGGTTSYDQPIMEDVKAGQDVRVYLPTARGLAVGNHMVLTTTPRRYGGPFDRSPIKALGWDKERGLPYAVVDLKYDHLKDTLFYDKHVVNSMTVTDFSQSDNQSMGLMVARKNYAQGDSFVISARATTMGNVMSAAGDEGGLTYSSDIDNDLRPFRSTVERVDWARQELVYAPGPVRNHTLGTSRPVINHNTGKWITAGTAMIVAPGHVDPWDPNDPRKTGRTFGGELFPGGAIVGSADCGWTADVVGRFFALDEPGEYLDPAQDSDVGYTPAPDIRIHRWYQIMKFEERADGTKRIYIERTRWWCRHDIAPNLYDRENYSWDGHLKPMRYVIAPGAVVADVSRAWTDSASTDGRVGNEDTRTLVLAPSPDDGTAFDFEPGDPIAQAIGSDPWNVTGMRVRHFNYLPSTIEDGSFESMNLGRVAVESALSISGGAGDLAADQAHMKDGNPRFRHGINIHASTAVGLRFGGDVRDAAIRFEQPHGRPQPIEWRVEGSEPRRLLVDPKTGDLGFNGGVRAAALRLDGGLSAGDQPARNLRGISEPVAAGAAELEVRFPTPEADARYAVQVQPSWLTILAVDRKTAEGFVVRFAQPPASDGALDWLIVR